MVFSCSAECLEGGLSALFQMTRQNEIYDNDTAVTKNGVTMKNNNHKLLQAIPFGNRQNQRNSTLTDPEELGNYIHGLNDKRIKEAKLVAERFSFKVPIFYINNILSGTPDDPLLDLILPCIDELDDIDEEWDSTPSPYRVSTNRFWIQKYEHNGLLRVTNNCSGRCRFCYLKKKLCKTSPMTFKDIDQVFDDLELRGERIQEVILSGGDPLCASASILKAISERLNRLRLIKRDNKPHIVIHTREPIWNPVRLLENEDVWKAFRLLHPKAVVFQVIHPREITKEFVNVCLRICEEASANAAPILLCQHPIFNNVNASVELLAELYDKLISISPTIIPYYMVHPFANGTLPRHRISLERSKSIYDELASRPGWYSPRLVVPTPKGKCIIAPFQELRQIEGNYLLKTKDGHEVLVK
jgi:L-lysine 2,3-aminomutase